MFAIPIATQAIPATISPPTPGVAERHGRDRDAEPDRAEDEWSDRADVTRRLRRLLFLEAVLDPLQEARDQLVVVLGPQLVPRRDGRLELLPDLRLHGSILAHDVRQYLL